MPETRLHRDKMYCRGTGVHNKKFRWRKAELTVNLEIIKKRQFSSIYANSTGKSPKISIFSTIRSLVTGEKVE